MSAAGPAQGADRARSGGVGAVRPIRIGVIGLGRAFTLMLPTFVADPRVRVVAAADPSPAARAQFASDFGGPAHADAAALCAEPGVDFFYVAAP